MNKQYDVCFPLKYTDRQDQEKTQWQRVGKAFAKDGGKLSIKLELVPVCVDPKDGLWLHLFEPKPKDGQAPAAAAPAQQTFEGDQVPF